MQLSMLMVRDLAARDPHRFHLFLWSNHIGYAIFYDAPSRFGAEIEASRLFFFDQLKQELAAMGLAADEVRSVLDVGSSVGRNLHYVEKSVFPRAERLVGVDIDARAIQEGRRMLAAMGSRVELKVADMETLAESLEGETFDVVLCSGVLLYLDYSEAVAAVTQMLALAKQLLAMSGVADEQRDNATLERSWQRSWDSSYVHNLDAVVEAAGGVVVGRRHETGKLDSRQTIYFVYARLPQNRVSKPLEV